MLLYSLTIFLSAFLLFQVQPIIAKMILPWFGGTSAVWSTCMLFFQVVLLLGYVYAHWLNRKLNPRRQAVAHIAVLAISLAALPDPAESFLEKHRRRAAVAAHPGAAGCDRRVAVFPAVLDQPAVAGMVCAETQERVAVPAFRALELRVPAGAAQLSAGGRTESGGPLTGVCLVRVIRVFAAVCGLTAWRSSQATASADEPESVDETDVPAPSWMLRLIWLGLAASASVLLLAVTTHLTQDVAAIPFLWILPLTIYLLSFILCFEAPRYYRRELFLPLLVVALAFMTFELWPGHRQVASSLAAVRDQYADRTAHRCLGLSLFVCCMVCHGELARLKPHPRYLTGFYVIVSLGGAIGGLFVGLVAPNLFRAYYEFPIGLGFCALVLVLVYCREIWRQPLSAQDRGDGGPGRCCFAVTPGASRAS